MDPDWVQVGPGVILGGAPSSPFSATASLAMGLYPRVTFTFSSQGNGEALRAIQTALHESPWSGTGLHISGRQIEVTSDRAISWVVHGHSQTERQASCAHAANWIRHVHTTLAPVLGPALINPISRQSKTARTDSLRSLTHVPREQVGHGQAAETGRPEAEPAAPAPAERPPACAICGKALPPGRKRHQQCERGSHPRSAAEPPVVSSGTTTASQARERYRVLIARIERMESSTASRRTERTVQLPHRLRSAREAVLLRCEGHCENPGCTGQPTDVTAQGTAILEVDHVQPIADEGRDHPEQMVALCPNCHAMKTRGSRRADLQQKLLAVAHEANQRWAATSQPHSGDGG
ncbi:HNH endonuclease signature motif containing protein [Streptomyces sp. NPDC001549]|uniref:HNH endonuclease signature motif containing protein n=1 Tax=Streptomyces sp. NPDC001549 TaxID=3364586 RepID=UPI0036BC1BC0